MLIYNPISWESEAGGLLSPCVILAKVVNISEARATQTNPVSTFPPKMLQKLACKWSTADKLELSDEDYIKLFQM